MELWQGILFVIYTFVISAMAYRKGIRDERQSIDDRLKALYKKDPNAPASMDYMQAVGARKEFHNN